MAINVLLIVMDSVTFPFKVANPLTRPAHIHLRASGLTPGWFMDVDPFQFWLDPGETIEGIAVIRADSTVPLEKEGKPSPVITLEALVEKGDTFVPFGGISGVAHPVRKAKIDDIKIEPQVDGVTVSGTALTSEFPVVDATVSMRVLQSDLNREVRVYHTESNSEGRFVQKIETPIDLNPDNSYYLDVSLSPTLGTSPVDMKPVKFNFKTN